MVLGLADEARVRVRNPGPDRDEDLHQVRLVLKRLRSLLRLFRPVMGASLYPRENRRLRSVAVGLAAFRDASVTNATLAGLRTLAVGREERKELRAVQGVLGPEASPTDAVRLHQELAMKDAAREIRLAGQRLAAVDLDRGGWLAIEPGLRRAYRKARRAMKRAREDHRPESFHEWRKCVKHLFHHLRFLNPAWPKRRLRWIQHLDQLQNTAGKANDLVVLKSQLTALVEGGRLTSSPDALFKRLEFENLRLGRKCLKLGQAALAQSPSPFIRDARRCWKGWRK